MSPRPKPLPPRAALPRDVQIPALPSLGDTWYDRGPGYWARRVGLTLMWVVVLAAIASIDVGLFSGIRRSSPTGFAVFLAVDVALTIALLVYAAVGTARQWNTASLPGQVRAGGFLSRAGAVRNGFARFLCRVAVLVVAVAFLFFPGFFVLLFLTSLMPQTPAERHARLWMAERLRERGQHVPAT
jgi:hypothetical protein